MRIYSIITKPGFWLLALFISLNVGAFAQNKKTNRGEISRKSAKQSINKDAKKTSNKKLDRVAKLEKDGQTVSKKKKTNATLNSNNKIANSSNTSIVAKQAERCSTTEAYNIRLQDPKYVNYLKEIKDKVNASSLGRRNIPCDGTNSVIIPVAVHFDAGFNCSNVQCLVDATEAQIVSLNDDFDAINADLQAYVDLLASCGGSNVASDGACLTFCLANQNHPAGSGLSDGQPAITIGQYVGGFGSGYEGAPEWQGYLNVFAGGSGAGGVADGIPGALNGDGVSVTGGVFGGPNFGPCSSGTIVDDGGGAGWDLGRTLTHEVGHYLGLYHVWGDINGGGCDGDDIIADTPDQADSSSGCTADCSTLAACNAGEFVQYNFMDYFDDPCLVMFTNDQAIVMNNFANAVNWANDVIDLGCSDYSETSISSCVISAGFSPPDGTSLTLCADDGSPLFIVDDSSLAVSWDWTFTVTSGDLTLSSSASTLQTPDLSVEGGTFGTIEVTQEVCDADGNCASITNTYTITNASGDACPNECDYTLELIDTYGDGWNDATLDVQSNGISIAGSPFGSAFTTGTSEVITITLTDSEVITFNQINGGFPIEEGFILTDPFGSVIFDASAGNVGAGEVFSFEAYCETTTCNDGLQNGSEGGVDCGGDSNCPNCCSNGVQDDGETGVDCGGANCASCPSSCPDGFVEIVNETFDSCMMPAGWTISSTDGGSEADGSFSFSAGPGDVPGGGAGPSPDFAGCIAIINDDASDAVGIGCIISPVIDLTPFINTSLTFDWQHEAVSGGGELIVQVWDGTMWVTVFSADDDSNGTNETVALDAYANINFQVQFCYDDEGGFQWAAGFDNITVCGAPNDECPTAISATDVSGDYCDGTTLNLMATGNPNVTYVWSSSSASVVIADPTASSTTATLSTTQLCLSETVELSAIITCNINGAELFNGIVSSVNVFPNPPADAADLVNYVDCTTVSPISNCQNVITITPEVDGLTYSVTFAHASGPNCCPDVTGSTTDLIIDGSFEAGQGGGAWIEASSNFGSPICDIANCGVGTGTGPSDGDFWTWFGGVGASEIGSVCQDITIPTGLNSLNLAFDLEMIVCDSTDDFMQVTVDGTQVFFVDGSSALCGVLGYAPQAVDLLAAGVMMGSTVTLCFESEIFGTNGTGSNFFVDNVSVLAEQLAGEDPCTTAITCDASVPTLSQWGLIYLALLLMIFGSVTLAVRSRAFITLKK